MSSWSDFVKKNGVSAYDTWAEVPDNDIYNKAYEREFIEIKLLKQYFCEQVLLVEKQITKLNWKYVHYYSDDKRDKTCDKILELRGVLKTYKELVRGL